LPVVVKLSAEAPAGFVSDDARLSAPDLSETPQIALEQWNVFADGPQLLVTACFGGQAGSWLPEADEVALQKLSQITLSTALRAGLDVGMKPIDSAREGAVRTQTLDGEGLRAKTLLGFEPGGVAHGCFALCVRGGSECQKATANARLEGTLVEPPAPSLAMRGLSWAVHHPDIAAGGIAGLFVVSGIVAILTRRRVRVSQ
jgi:hypothetical protein